MGNRGCEKTKGVKNSKKRRFFKAAEKWTADGSGASLDNSTRLHLPLRDGSKEFKECKEVRLREGIEPNLLLGKTIRLCSQDESSTHSIEEFKEVKEEAPLQIDCKMADEWQSWLVRQLHRVASASS
jgi:hypothetical protein